MTDRVEILMATCSHANHIVIACHDRIRLSEKMISGRLLV